MKYQIVTADNVSLGKAKLMDAIQICRFLEESTGHIGGYWLKKG